MNTIYRVRWGSLVIIITIVISIVIICVNMKLVYYLFNSGDFILSGIVLLIFNFTIGFTIAHSPLYLRINDHNIFLKKIYGKVIIDFSEIKSIDLFNSNFDIRMFGSGGFFGFIGIFSNDKYGWYRSYVGNPKQSFLIVTKNSKKYVFSCEKSEDIISIVKKHIKNE